VLAFLIGPWKLTFGQSAVVLMSSGIGAILGAYIWGWLADKIGRRKVFIGTVLNFSIATGLLYFTPDNGWIYLTIMRFFVGFGVGGLYCVDLPLVQEFMPSSKRGWVGGLVTCVIPLGVGMGAVLGAFMGPTEWRLLFVIGVAPSLLVLLVRIWVPESPWWLMRQGRYEERASRSPGRCRSSRARCRCPTRAKPTAGGSRLVRAVQVPAQPARLLARQCRRADRFLRHRAVGALAVRAAPESDAAGSLEDVHPADRERFRGRLSSRTCRTSSAGARGGLLGFGAGILVILAGTYYDAPVRAIGLLADPGGDDVLRRRRFRHRRALRRRGLAVAPSHHGHGSAYGFGGIGKILGPVGLAPHRRLRQLPQARRSAAANSDRLPLSRMLVPGGRTGLLFSSASRPRASRSTRSIRNCWPAPPPAERRGRLGHADPDRRGPCRQPSRDRARAIRPPGVEAASNAIEETRRLPTDLLDRLHEQKLFRLLMPRSSNGIEDRSDHLLPRDRDHRERRRLDRLVPEPGGRLRHVGGLSLPACGAGDLR
jgi:putative MFS transporter